MRWLPIAFRHTFHTILLVCITYLLPSAAHAVPCDAKNEPLGCTKAGAQTPPPVVPCTGDNVPKGCTKVDPPKPNAGVPNHIVKAVYSLSAYQSCYKKDSDNGKKPQKANCKPASENSRTALVGAGDIVVALDADAYKAVAEHKAKTSAKEFIFFNGVELTDETEAKEEDTFDGYVFQRIYLKPKEKSKVLWGAIVREASLTNTVPLRVGYGWSADNQTSTTDYTNSWVPTIAVSNDTNFLGAIAGVAVLVTFALAVGVQTGVLRDRYPEQLRAAAAEARLLRAKLDGRSTVDRTALLVKEFTGYRRDTSGYDDSCREVADTALRVPASATTTPKLVVGLAESDISFSLTRTQLFAWFLFAVAAGIYFWFLLGELPALDKSILGLLGISAGSAGVSWAVDAADKTAVKQPNAGLSTGFFSDLVRDADDKDQVHRLQAVVVNVLLLGIGIVHVVRSITYPTFDDTWLIFLTVSGATFALGKQMNEKK